MRNNLSQIVDHILFASGWTGTVKERAEAQKRLLKVIDDAGFVLMPQEPTQDLINASLLAMRRYEKQIGNGWDKQSVKQVLRYTAMVERMRAKFLPASDLGVSEREQDGKPNSTLQAVARAADTVLLAKRPDVAP